MADHEEALELAGAYVQDYKEFGSYQGNWYAFVSYKGKPMLVGGAYGSCSGCDAIVDLDSEDEDEREAIIAEGQSCLNDPLDINQEIKEAKENSEWDTESEEMLVWLEAHNRNKKFNEKIEKIISEN